MTEDELKQQYFLLVRTLYRELVKTGKSNMLYYGSRPVTEHDIMELEQHEPITYYIWPSVERRFYLNPKIILEYKRYRVRDYGVVSLYIYYGIKRYNKKIELNRQDLFIDIIRSTLSALELQWATYMQTEANIRAVFNETLEISSVIHVKNNNWHIKFNDTNLHIWYNSKTKSYVFQYSNLKSIQVLNEVSNILNHNTEQ